MSEPKTAAGRKFASRIYGITGIFVEGDILAIEAEAAAQAEDSLDVERLAEAIRSGTRGADLDWAVEWYASPNEMAEEIAAEYARLAAEEPHD